jgi:hypothetical protein
MTEIKIKWPDEDRLERCDLDLLHGDTAILSLSGIYCSETCARANHCPGPIIFLKRD